MSEADVKSYYDHLVHQRDRTDILRGRCHAVEYSSRIDTLLTTLDLLNIKIEGVNKNGES